MIKTYVVTWNNVIDKLPNILNQIDSYEVINSDAPNQEGWHNLGLIWYYNQVKYALDHFINESNEDIFCFITGDISSNNFKEIYQKANFVMQKEEVGLYAPNLTYEPWNKNVCYIGDYDLSKNLYLSCQTEGVFFFMKRQIAEQMKIFMQNLYKEYDLYSMKSGWGLDYVWCAISLLNNKIILRDDEYIVEHPPGSSYDHEEAKKEKKLVTNYFIYNSLDNDKNKIIDFFTLLDAKVSGKIDV